ncbi:cytochrome P450 [Epithele typhae]|uniref:cytochrome P450 n=1 Tax=Epithele typhae TaxID=378194 RepID=UPI002007FAE7|nr:cytochrome P450 [Epithele typhae]KAH9917678.1 cytochrome P450 [Epithele typhae]
MSPVLYLLALCLFLPLYPIVKKLYKQRCLAALPGPKSTSVLFGVAREMYAPFSMPFRMSLYTGFGRVVKIPLLFGEYVLAVSDPVALAALLKHDTTFELPDFVREMTWVTWGPNLVAVSGDEHHKQRKMLNPAFSVARLRTFVPDINAVSQLLVDTLKTYTTSGTAEVDVSQLYSGFALECTGRTGLGQSFGPLTEDGTPHSRALKEFGPTISKLRMFVPYIPWARRTFPRSWLAWAAKHAPIRAVRDTYRISETAFASAAEIYNEKAGDVSDGTGKDLMSIVVRQNKLAPPADALSKDSLIGQISMFFFGATDTTSSTLSRITELLATHPGVQARLREEITEATEGAGKALVDFDYEAFGSLQYLDAIIRETLRMYPVLQGSNRMSDVDAVLPLSEPIVGTDGKAITELFVPAGTLVIGNNVGYNYDTAIWGADAHEWRPERWLAPLPESVTDNKAHGMYSYHMGFGGGVRACIGYSMALIMLRIAVSHLIMAFKLAPSEKEIVWRMAGVLSPTVKGSTLKRPTMPVLLTHIQ